MSQYMYAVLPYDSGITFDAEDETRPVYDFSVRELKGI